MKPCSCIWTGLLLLISIQASFAQSFSAKPRNLSFQNFRTEEGLSDNFIYNIYQDSRGFIWISTREGLNRFDGTSFKKFYASREKDSKFRNSQVNSLYEYQKNKLLIATGPGLVTMNLIDQVFSNPGDPLLDSSFAFHFFIEDPNKIWLVLKNGYVIIDSNLRIQKKCLDRPKEFHGFQSMCRLADGRYVAEINNQLYFLDEKTNTLTKVSDFFGQPIESAFTFYDPYSNSIFVAPWLKPLVRLDFTNKKIYRYNVLSVIRCVIRDSHGNLWLGSEDGLLLYDEKSDQFVRYKHQPEEGYSLVSNNVLEMFEDRNKNLWIGTSEGLSKLSQRALSLTYFKKEFQLKGNDAEVYDITKGNDGNIYIATYGNGLFRIDEKQNVSSIAHDLMTHAWSVNNDKEELIVTGHSNMLFSLNYKTSRTKELPILKPFRDTADLATFAFTDSRGGKWISLNQQMGLFYRPTGANSYTHFSSRNQPAEFPHSYFNIVTEDKAGRVWFGMNKRSDFSCYDLNTDKFTNLQLDSVADFHYSGIGCMLADEKTVWIGTNGTGLVHYDPETGNTKLYTYENGLASSNIASLVFDKKHRLWVGTSRGLSCLLPGEEKFISFSYSAGLPETLFGEGASYYDSAKNLLYAGAKSSVILFNPDEFLQIAEPAKPLHIDEVLINGKKIPFSSLDHLKLKHDQNNLQFFFTAIDFEDPGNIQFLYKLEGADKDWIKTGNQHSASYANLSNGHYKFLVKAIRPGSATEMNTEIPFGIYIQPPYWRTWWFRSLLALLVVTMLYALAKTYYLRQLERQRLLYEKQQAIEQERTRIATDMHDDLGAGLSRIRFLSQSLSNKKNEDPVIQESLEKITGYSDEMTEKMGEIVWALNEKNDTLADLVSYTRNYAMEYLNTHKLNCKVNTPLQLPGSFIAGDIRRNIFLAVKECLHNIVKHASATEVDFSIVLNGNIEITIHDNGKGIDWNNQRPFSNGLDNVKKRMKDIKGKAAFIQDKGTKVVLEAPLKV